MKFKIIQNVMSHLVTSRAIVDKIQMSNEYFNKYQTGMNELTNWVSMFKGFDPASPQTWVSTGIKVAQKVSVPKKKVEPPNRSLVARFFAKMQLVKVDHLNAVPFYQDLAHKNLKRSKLIAKTPEGVLRMLPLEGLDEGFFFFELEKPESHRGKDIDILPFLPDFVDAPERRKKINEALADLFWQDKEHLFVSLDSESIEFTPIGKIEREYEGQLTDLYSSLSLYKDKDVRRVLLFNGPPGTGKSTLAINLADRLSHRTIVLTHKTLEWCTVDDWNYLLSMMQPEMIIVDDIDRLGNTLNKRLFLFEETQCKVPLVVLTSNNETWLPDAFKRPGRIDQMIEMETPPDHLRKQVVLKIAEQEGVEIPPNRLDLLDEIHQKYTGAYIVELLRRAKVEGWNYQIPSYDRTFRDLKPSLRDRWNNVGSNQEEPPSADDLEIDDFEIDF